VDLGEVVQSSDDHKPEISQDAVEPRPSL
jgi:hypothetical protein